MKIKKEIINKIKDKQREKERIYKLYLETDKIVTKHEIKRLKKALKDENIAKMHDWIHGFGMQLDNDIAKRYNEYYEQKLKEDSLFTIKCIEVVLIYTLRYNDKCKFGGNRIEDFLKDFRTSFELISNNEYKIQDYIEQLKSDKITVEFKN